MINLIIMAKCLSSMYAVDHVVRGNFLQGIIASRARRALETEKIDSLEKLSDYSEEEIMQFHGFGKNAMEKLKNHMKENQLSFKKNEKIK
jgi:ERCC4-type nuclease